MLRLSSSSQPLDMYRARIESTTARHVSCSHSPRIEPTYRARIEPTSSLRIVLASSLHLHRAHIEPTYRARIEPTSSPRHIEPTYRVRIEPRHRAYIEPTYRARIEPTSSLHRAFIVLASSLHRASIEPTSSLHRAYIEPSSCQNIKARCRLDGNLERHDIRASELDARCGHEGTMVRFAMKIYGLTLVLLFANGSWCCSLRPNIPHYSITDRAVLAPLVIHGRVLNTTATRSFQQYRACVKVLEVIKGDSDLPREMCFGWFGMEELCLTHVFRDNEYIFYMNSDRTARYKDGVPTSAILANSRTTSLTKQGYCNPYLPQSTPCDRPTIKSFQSVIRVQEGQSAVMSCYASGTFPLLVTWSKMSSRLTHRIPHNYNQYRIPSVGVSDTGVYICTIRNPAGVTTALVRLYVDPVPCGAFLFLRPGEQSEIQSPNYPQPYSKDKMCSWRICPAHGQRVKLDFTHFDLRRNFDDNLQIYHGTSLFDYNTFYCENTILIRFIPRVAYFSTMTGRVLHNYKNTGPKPGQDIRIE
ncbi:hypothetical protein QZH41_000873 [Actinostola sp. cb2023]|nr:hypothetical protein QZH41_000873 [Actinostola sp. cb2023]